jgi:uncharacterized protein involved in cysteine biosynthesis
MTTKIQDLIQQSSESPGPFVKAVNFIAAMLGIGTALNLVNLLVGVLSAGWLITQLYFHYRYKVPYERAKLEMLQRQLAANDLAHKVEERDGE